MARAIPSHGGSYRRRIFLRSMVWQKSLREAIQCWGKYSNMPKSALKPATVTLLNQKS
uniref:Uncharacterized protein n=1 Tax=Anguilla anguilla TaxID=7936 RepID=A0A0E9SFC0_ANGAN